ncbi:MAG: DNA polymerase III subunit gamma/tau [Elusimicrobiota bacterium]
MSYTVLARKYRPQKFDDVIGQEHIVRVLKNAIKEKRIAYGYIFSGQRGIGKTTVARIFAKALNCKQIQEQQPCSNCNSCREIANSNSIDVMEIDAASNRGIEQIRELRENIKYAPSSSKYKIYIIDEAHQITPEAFNALLKTLEEPPAHAVFIFATTSTQKIPPTILSRCQRFSFRPLSIKEISVQIEKIAEKENIKIDNKAVAIIARSVGGALRDALSTFDQIISFCGTNITPQDVISILGIVKEDILSEMFECIEKNATKKLLQIVDKTVLLGYDPLNIVCDLQEYIRNVMLYKISPELVQTVSDTTKLGLYSQSLSVDVLFRLIQILSNCTDQMKNAEQPSIILEIFCVKLTQKYVGLDELIARLENLELSSPCLSSSENLENNEDKPIEEKSIEKKLPAAKNSEPLTPKTTPVTPKTTLAKTDSFTIDKPTWSEEKVRLAWSEILKNEKIRPRILSCFSGTKISIQNDGISVIEFDNLYKIETVLSNKNEWLPLMEEKLGGKFEFTTKIGDTNNSENEEIENEIPSLDTTINDESTQSICSGTENVTENVVENTELSSDAYQQDNDIMDANASLLTHTSIGKNKKSGTTMPLRNTSTSTVKNIIDLFGGSVVKPSADNK